MSDTKREGELQEFTINGACKVRFDPADSAFAQKLFGAFAELDSKQEAYLGEISKCSDKAEIFHIARRRDTEMREMIDGVLGSSVCDALFGDIGVLALSGGYPRWSNLMLGVMGACTSDFAQKKMRTDPRIRKYQNR